MSEFPLPVVMAVQAREHVGAPADPISRSLDQLLAEESCEFDLVITNGTSRIVAEVKRHSPELILLDKDMPGDDGYAIWQQLQGHRQTRHIPVLFVSHHSTAEAVLEPDDDVDVSTDDPAAVFARLAREVKRYRKERLIRDALSSWELARSDELTAHELEVLESGGFLREARVDPRPIAETTARYEKLLAEGLDVSTAAQRLGVSQGRIRQRLTAKPPQLYGIRQGKAWLLPDFQFTQQGLVPHIDKVIGYLPSGLNPVAVENFFRLPQLDLEDDGQALSPLDWLSRGQSWEAVADLAEEARGPA